MFKNTKELASILKRLLRLEKSAVRYDSDLTCCQINSMEVGDTIEDDDLVVVKDSQGRCLLKAQSCCYTEVTRAEAEALVAGSLLKTNTLYKITDRGDRGIFLVAISPNKFELEGVRLMLIPNGVNWAGVDQDTAGPLYEYWSAWVEWFEYSTNDYVYWQGLVYINIGNSNTSTPPDQDGTNWAVIPKSLFESREYREKQFGIIYDFANDWISKQWDEHGNVFGIDYSRRNEEPFDTVGNPVDISDWMQADREDQRLPFRNNVCAGIWSNHLYYYWDGEVIDGIQNNNMHGSIFGNFGFRNISNNSIGGSLGITEHNSTIYTTIDIYNNKNLGDISTNALQNYVEIIGNSNIGDISNNFLAGLSYPLSVVNNSNIGNIQYNIVNFGGFGYGGIKYNTNDGSIEYNICNGDDYYGEISYNSNEGDISYNSEWDAAANGDPFNAVSYIRHNTNKGNISYNTSYQWGSLAVIEYNSNNGGVSNNLSFYTIDKNCNIGEISSNESDSISFNSNSGYITYNLTQAIVGNNNIGDISANTANVTYISNNMNNGGILSNDNIGYISGNANNGYIGPNTSSPATCNIYNNINNGYISGAQVADVFDVIVNK